MQARTYVCCMHVRTTRIRTDDDGDLPVRLGEGVRCAAPGADDDGAMHGGTGDVAVRVPPQRASFLSGEDDPVGELVAGLDGTLCYVLRPVRPRVPWVVHAEPAKYRDMSPTCAIRTK